MLRTNEQGQGFVEYGMILIIVAVGVVVILVLLGDTLEGLYTDIIQSF